MKLLNLTLLLVFCHTLSAQTYLRLSREKVRKELSKQAAGFNSPAITIRDSANTLVYSFRDNKLQPADFIYEFDEKGKCTLEKVVANCDSCFNKYLDNALNRSHLGWVKISDKKYISSFTKKMMLEISTESPAHSFVIRRMRWNQGTYQSLLNSRH